VQEGAQSKHRTLTGGLLICDHRLWGSRNGPQLGVGAVSPIWLTIRQTVSYTTQCTLTLNCRHVFPRAKIKVHVLKPCRAISRISVESETNILEICCLHHQCGCKECQLAVSAYHSHLTLNDLTSRTNSDFIEML